MRKILLTAFILALATPAWSAQQSISTITTKQSREELRGAINTELGKVQSNTTELYSLAIAAPWLAQATAPSITNVFWVDTSGASPVIKYYDGDSWEVAAAGEGGTYTLPVATSSVLGGVKQGAGTSIAADGTLSVTAAGLGLGTTDNPSFLSVHASGGSLAAANNQVTKAWASGLPYTANVTSVIHGGKHYICTSTHTAGSTTEPGVGALWATVWSEVSGAGDNLGTAAASDIIALFGSGSCSGYLYSDGTCSTPSGAAHDAVTLDANLGNNLLGLSTQQLTLDSQTANYVFAAPNGSAGVPSFRALVAADVPTLNQNTTGTAAGLTAQYIDWNAVSGGSSIANKPAIVTTIGATGADTNIPTEQAVREAFSALPNLAFDSATLTTTTVGDTDTISVKANTFQGYDADWLGITPNGAALVSAANYAAMKTLLDTDDIQTLTGIAAGTAHLGTFTGTTIADSSTIKTALQLLETSVETKAPSASPVFSTSVALPQGASPTVDAAGETAVDTTSDQFIYYGGGKRVLTYKKQIDFAVKTPVDADDFLLFKAQTAMTITDIHVIAQGGTSISVDVQECDSAGANCATVDAAITADTDGAEDDGTLSNGAIDAGDWVKVVLGAPSGTVNYLAGSIYYVETAD